MNEDMSNLMNQINNMLKNNQIPDEVKNLMGQFANNSQTSNEDNNSSSGSTHTSSNDLPKHSLNNSSTENSSIPEFDMATMMKIKKIMDSMKESRNDPRTNLLKSLKPYLKESRKEKVDQYIQLFGMGKAFEMLGPLGGEKQK